MTAPTNGTNSTSDVDHMGYTGAGDIEKGRIINGPAHIERMITPGGHPIDFSQPAIPVQHRKYGNPIPIGLIAFSMGFMMTGLLTVGASGIKAPNAVLPSLSESSHQPFPITATDMQCSSSVSPRPSSAGSRCSSVTPFRESSYPPFAVIAKIGHDRISFHPSTTTRLCRG